MTAAASCLVLVSLVSREVAGIVQGRTDISSHISIPSWQQKLAQAATFSSGFDVVLVDRFDSPACNETTRPVHNKLASGAG